MVMNYICGYENHRAAHSISYVAALIRFSSEDVVAVGKHMELQIVH